MSVTRHVRVLAIAAAVAGLAALATAQPGERLSDKEAKAVIESVDHTRDRFEDQLDGKLKRSIVRGPRREVNVGDYLEDLQQNVKKLQERFTSKYAASAEAEAVLRQGSEIDAFMKVQPAGTKGASEWDRMSAELARLALAYRTTFPLPAGGAVRRVNDAEVSSAAAKLAQDADRLKKEVGKEKSLDKAQRDAIRGDLDFVKKQAGVVKSRASGGKPATAEARQVADAAARVTTALGGPPLSASTAAALADLRGTLGKVSHAYGM